MSKPEAISLRMQWRRVRRGIGRGLPLLVEWTTRRTEINQRELCNLVEVVWERLLEAAFVTLLARVRRSFQQHVNTQYTRFLSSSLRSSHALTYSGVVLELGLVGGEGAGCYQDRDPLLIGKNVVVRVVASGCGEGGVGAFALGDDSLLVLVYCGVETVHYRGKIAGGFGQKSVGTVEDVLGPGEIYFGQVAVKGLFEGFPRREDPLHGLIQTFDG